MINIFKAPGGDAPIRSQTLYVLSLIWAVVTLLIVSIELYLYSNLWSWWIIRLGVTLLICTSSIALDRWGYSRLGSWSFIIMLWLSFTAPCYLTGGIMATGVLSQMSVILTAGFLLGWRGGITIGLMTVAVDFGFAYIEMIGKLPSPSIVHNPLMRWVSSIIPFGTILALEYYALSYLRLSLKTFQRQIDKERITTDSLKASKEKYKAIITVSNAASWEYHHETGRAWSSSEYFAMIGLDHPSGHWDDSMDGVWIDRLHPDDRERSIKIFDQFLKQNTTSLYENIFRLRHENGSWVWVWARARRLRDKDGRLTDVTLGTHIDITAQQEALEAMRLSEERYKSIITVSNTGAWEYHIETGRIWYSAQYFAMIGIHRTDGHWDESLEDNWVARLHDEDREQSIKVVNEFLKGGAIGWYENIYRMRNQNGEWLWIWSRGTRLQDANGNITNTVLGTHIDITERVKAEEQLKQREQITRKITSQVPANTYMFEINEDGSSNILFFNRGTDEYNHDIDLKESSEHSDRVREVIHDDDKVKFNDKMKEAYRTLKPISFQFRMVVGENVRWRWVKAIPDKDPSGKVLWYGATYDITPLVEYIVSVEQIIFDIGHVIRRPISSMLGMTKLVMDGNISNEEIKEMSGRLYSIAEEMDRFSRELNNEYHRKRQLENFEIDISSALNKRTTLFN